MKANAAAASSYTVIPADNGVETYRDVIEELWKNNLPRILAGRFDWLYGQNPRGPARTWLVTGHNDAIVGIGSLYPRRMAINGNEHVVGVAVDFAIDKKHRVLGPALKIQKAIVKDSRAHGFLFNYAYPSANSTTVFLRAGYRPIGEIRSCVKLLTVRKLLSEYRVFAIVASAASGVIDFYLRLSDRWRGRARSSRDAAFDILQQCDERFDALWQEARSRYAVIGEKSASFLNWRYAANTTDRYRFWCMFSADRRRLKGFIVYTVRENAAVIAELFVPGLKEDILAPMLLEFALRMRNDGVSHIAVSYFGDDRLFRQLRSLGFIERKAKRSFFVYWDAASDPGLVRTIADKQNWFHFGGDLDLS